MNKVIVEPGEDGYFVAHVPSLKSRWSQGRTKEEVLQNIREAIELYLEPEPTGCNCDSSVSRPKMSSDSMILGKTLVAKARTPLF